jgi:multiple sugar transport system ATP-binding protein
MAAVSFEKVTKIYPNGHTAIRTFDLEIRDGELMAIVGPSGCGKSTLLRMLAGLESITSGTLHIDHETANHLSPQARNIAMVFQDYALYPTMSVWENLSFPLKMRKLASAEVRRRVDWAAGLLDLGAVLERLPRELSGGQRQRVAMGRALVREPSVFLLDEPLSNLDTRLRGQVRAEIGDLQRRTGTTMVYVTHDQVEAMTLGQRIAVLDRGQLQQVATPEGLYEHPANVFVAGFIGSPPMNLFEAQLRQDSHGQWQIEVEGLIVAHASQATVALFASDVATSRRFMAGIRPEALKIAEASEPGFLANILNYEYLGHETLVHLLPTSLTPCTKAPWVARLPGMLSLQKNDVVNLSVVAASAVYVFDKPPTSI